MTFRSIRRSIAVVAVIGLVLAAAGCGGSGSNSSGEAIQTQVKSPPAKGNLSNVTWDLPQGEPVPLDPTQDWNVSENSVLVNLCDQLLWVNADFKIVPGLASSFSHPTPLTWVYNIRPGVKFWDGTPLTADDVVFSLDRQLQPTAFYSTPFGAMIKSVKKTGPLQVTITSKQPNILVHEMMASGMAVITEKAYTQKAGKNYGTPSGGVMCSGPFKFGKWTPGQQLTIVRNPNYWNKAMVPKVQQVTFKFITDSSTLTRALTSGDIDGTYDPPASAADQLQNSSVGHQYIGTGTNSGALVFTQSDAFKDFRLRRALSLAIDRSTLASVAFSGTAAAQLSGNILPISYPDGQDQVYTPYLDQVKKEPGYSKPDIEQAKKLVAEANKPNRPLTLAYAAGDATISTLATTIVAQARDVGIDMKGVPLQPADFSALYVSSEAAAKYDALLGLQYWTDVADPLQHFALNDLPGVTNLSGYKASASVLKDYSAAIASNDPIKRAKLTVKIDKAVGNDPYVSLVFEPQRMFLNNKITGPAASFPYVIHYPWATTLGAAG